MSSDTRQGELWWLASYPKSGNTWMRILLSNWFSASDEPVSINDLRTGGIASARWLFDEQVGVEASDFTLDEIERLRPAVFAHFSDRLASDVEQGRRSADSMPILIKVHDASTPTQQGEALIPASATAGVIYLVRNPLDIVASWAHHRSSGLDDTIAFMGDEDAALVDRNDGLGAQLRQRLLSWSGHVRSWTDRSDVDVCVVRYEDLLRNTAAEFGRVLGFIGQYPDAERLKRCVAASTFGQLRAEEAVDGFDERLADDRFFFRRGIEGGWRDELTDEQADRICADHGPVMAQFGYARERTSTPKS